MPQNIAVMIYLVFLTLYKAANADNKQYLEYGLTTDSEVYATNDFVIVR